MAALHPILRFGLSGMALMALGVAILMALVAWHPAYSGFALGMLLGGCAVALLCLLAGVVLSVLALIAAHLGIATHGSHRALMAWVLLWCLALTALTVTWFILGLSRQMRLRGFLVMVCFTFAAWAYLIDLHRKRPGAGKTVKDRRSGAWHPPRAGTGGVSARPAST
jgi:hypothetical protein